MYFFAVSVPPTNRWDRSLSRVRTPSVFHAVIDGGSLLPKPLLICLRKAFFFYRFVTEINLFWYADARVHVRKYGWGSFPTNWQFPPDVTFFPTRSRTVNYIDARVSRHGKIIWKNVAGRRRKFLVILDGIFLYTESVLCPREKIFVRYSAASFFPFFSSFALYPFLDLIFFYQTAGKKFRPSVFGGEMYMFWNIGKGARAFQRFLFFIPRVLTGHTAGIDNVCAKVGRVFRAIFFPGEYQIRERDWRVFSCPAIRRVNIFSCAW